VEIVAGVYQFKVPIPDNPLVYTNVYLIKGDNGHSLIDTGPPYQEALDALKKELGEINLGFQDITSIVVTHAHPDHFGLASKIKELSNAEVIMHEIFASFFKQERWKTMMPKLGDWQLANGMPREDALELQKQRPGPGLGDFFVRVKPDRTVAGGEKLSIGSVVMDVIWTPGHAPMHICLYDPVRKILFSGDHILPVITPNVSSDPRSITNPLGSYINSLKEMEQLEVDLVLPGHKHIFRNFRERVQQILEHHAQRIEDLLGVLGSEEKTAYQIASKMSWVGISHAVVLGENLPLSQQADSIGETLAHLEFLEFEGRVEKIIKEGIVFFHPSRSNL